MTVDAELMLIQWGAWVRSSGQSLGYPKESPISRVMREGAAASHATKKGEAHMPAAVEVIERCVLTMRANNRAKLRTICMHHFVGNENLPTIARKLKIDEDTARARIAAAIDYVEKYLTENSLLTRSPQCQNRKPS